MEKIGFFLVAIALASLAAPALADPEHREQLAQLCRREKKLPGLSALSQVRPLIELLRNDPGAVECEDKVAEAILKVGPVFELEDVCSQQALDVIVDFWSNYVLKSSKSSKYLPKPLRKLFIAFGFQASKVCKQRLVDELERAHAESGITEEDVQFVTGPVKDNKNIDELMGKSSRLEDLALVVRIDSEAGQSREELEKQRDELVLSVLPGQKFVVEQLQNRCRNKFKPVYDTLILPIVRLASLGFNYKADSIEAQLESLRGQSVYRAYYSAILACEPVLKFTTVVIPGQKVDEAGDTHTVTLLDSKDVAKLKKDIGLTLDEPELAEVPDYKPTGAASVGDSVLDAEDAHLAECLLKYSRRFRDVDRVRMRMFRKLPKLMKIYLKSDKFRLGLTKASDAEKKRALSTVSSYGSSLFGPKNERSTSALFFIWLFKFTCKMVVIGGVVALTIFLGNLFPHAVAGVIIGCLVILAFIIPLMFLGSFVGPDMRRYNANSLIQQVV